MREIQWSERDLEEGKPPYRFVAVVASSDNTASEFVSPLKHTVYTLTLKTIHPVHIDSTG